LIQVKPGGVELGTGLNPDQSAALGYTAQVESATTHGSASMFVDLRRRSPAAVVAAGFTLWLGACATPQPLQFQDVVQRGRAGQPADQIIGAVRASRTIYALQGSDYGKLAQIGVPPQALDYLQQSFVSDVDLLTRYWVTGESLGGCHACYPQQVDLSGAGDGLSAQQSAPSTAYRPSQPLGLPDWYRPFSARLKPISVDDVRSMAKAGASDQAMIDAIRDARLTHIIGVGGLGPVATHPLAGLSGSELARLRQEGIPDPVVDELQVAFLGQFVEVQRLRYQNLGKGPSFN